METIAVVARELRKSDVIVDRQGFAYRVTELSKRPGELVRLRVSRGGCSYVYNLDRGARIVVGSRGQR